MNIITFQSVEYVPIKELNNKQKENAKKWYEQKHWGDLNVKERKLILETYSNISSKSELKKQYYTKVYQFSVKEEFKIEIQKHNLTLEEIPIEDLFEKYNIEKYLHNENGPALVKFTYNKKKYFIDGKKVKIKYFVDEKEIDFNFEEKNDSTIKFDEKFKNFHKE